MLFCRCCIGKTKLVFSQKKSVNFKREIEFLDEDDYSVTFRNGVWTKQHFTTKNSLQKALEPYFGEIKVLGSENRSNIYAICRNPKRWPIWNYKEALNIEFNMVYPNNYRHNRHEKLVKSILKNIF